MSVAIIMEAMAERNGFLLIKMPHTNTNIQKMNVFMIWNIEKNTAFSAKYEIQASRSI